MPYILKADKLESQSNKVTKLDNSVTDDQYPSAKAVYDALGSGVPGSGSGVGEAIENGGEIFNDYENNQANTEFSHAEGQSTVAGAKVFLAVAGDKENKIYTFDDTSEDFISQLEQIEVGDYYSYKCLPDEVNGITYNGTFDFCGTITSINGNTVTVSNFIKGQDEKFQQGYLWVPKKPSVGTVVPEVEYWQHAEGSNTIAIMGAAHAEGHSTVASGRWSHAEGKCTVAGYGSHAEGRGTEAMGLDSHSEGFHTLAKGEGAHAEGDHTVAKGNGAHAEGIGKTSDVNDTFAGGKRPDESYGALANGAHVEGTETKATKTNAHAEGLRSKAEGHDSHAEGGDTQASADRAHAEGQSTVSEGVAAHAEGTGSIAKGKQSHAEGCDTLAQGDNSHSEGTRTEALNTSAHSEGADTIAEGQRSHAEGNVTYAIGFAAHAEGGGDSTVGPAHKQTNFGAFGDFSHSEGVKTKAVGTASHSEGNLTIAENEYSHAEGQNTIAQGSVSHAEGYNTRAIGESSHAEGYATRSEGKDSHAEGIGTIAQVDGGHAEGTYNKITKDNLTNIPLNGKIRTDSVGLTAPDDRSYINWRLDNNVGSNVYGFEYDQFVVGQEYKFKLTFDSSEDVSTSINFFAYKTTSNLSAGSENRTESPNISITLNKGVNTIIETFTFVNYQFLGIRFYNTPAKPIGTNVSLIKLEIVDEEIDENIISSIGNGTSDKYRSNAFAAYKDGHIEIGKMGDTENSVATKEYVDANLLDLIGIGTSISEAKPENLFFVVID